MAEPAGYFVICPNCGTKVALPDDEPDDLFKVTECWECSRTFDYDEDDVQKDPPQENGVDPEVETA